MTQVTMREWAILTFIRVYWKEHGISPSITEVTDGRGTSSRGTTYRLLKKMEKRGLLRCGGETHRRRSIVLCKIAVGVTP